MHKLNPAFLAIPGLCGALLAHATGEAAPTKWLGRTSQRDGATVVEDKSATLVFGHSQSSHYTARAEVRLLAAGPPVTLTVLSDEPHGPRSGGMTRMTLGRDKQGNLLTVRWAEWNPATNRWETSKHPAAPLRFRLDPADKTWKAALADLQRDAVAQIPFPERWLRLRVDVAAARADIWLDERLLRRIPLAARREGALALTLGQGDQVRGAEFARGQETPTFRTIDLGPFLGRGTNNPPRPTALEAAGVPFVVCNEGRTWLDLRRACWPDWQRDPSTYNEWYDDGPLIWDDPRTPTWRVTVEDYSAVHVLAVADDDPNTVPTFTIRAGHLDGRRQSVLYDFAAAVPRQKDLAQEDPKRLVKLGSAEWVHTRVPLSVAFSQDLFHTLDLQLTKEIRLARRRPDPSRFRYRPLGLPSGVKIAALTLERSPIQVRVTSREAGHAFVEPRKPEFTVTLSNVSPQSQTFAIQAIAQHQDATETRADARGKLDPGQTREVTLAIPVSKRGYHDIAFQFVTNGKPLFTRTTSFAVLPPDTRKHRAESPFGTWDFSGGHFTCPDPDLVGSLYQKAGLRYGMFGFTAADRARWGVRQGLEPKLLKDADGYRAWLAKNPDGLPAAMLLHEHSISGNHVSRVPDIFHERPPYQLNEDEKKRFQGIWETAESMAKMMRATFPDVTLSLGNGPLPTKEELLRQKFPPECFDSLGNEAGSFGRPPEAQPPDWIANNASLWMDHELLRAFGYGDKQVTQCYEVCYPATNPGNLSEPTQAAYFVRHAMHSLAWGVPLFRFGTISDVGSSYRFSHWGAAGLVRPWPELNVKPAFVAVATMTRVLDGAKFTRALDLGSPSLFGVEFQRFDGQRVYVLWTVRGQRPVRFPVAGGRWLLTDEQGNDTPLAPRDGRLEVTLTPTPVYLIGDAELPAAEPGPPAYSDRPRGRVSEVAPLDSLTGWRLETERHYVLEYHNFMTPRRQGDFRFETVSEFDGQKNLLRVTPQPIPGGKPTMPLYAVLRHEKGIPLPGHPTEIGLWVNGNSSWGRVIFELQDAQGQTWISIGASRKGEPSPWLLDWMPKEALANTKQATQADWNTDDVFGLSRIDFDGWRYVGFPLPGNYPGEGYPWAASSQWRHDGDGVVHYPLTFRALIIELPEKTLHLTGFESVPRPEIYLRRLIVAEDDTPTVKTTVSEWERP